MIKQKPPEEEIFSGDFYLFDTLPVLQIFSFQMGSTASGSIGRIILQHHCDRMVSDDASYMTGQSIAIDDGYTTL
ncbi:MAG: SDR family oxidoreductase [Clostridiales bacterium]|nr:SDR family oxidoreductase [Clostridiales bacterium]